MALFPTKFAVGSVGGADVASGAEYFADVFRQIPAVGVPCAVFADGKGARGDGLGWIPCDEPQAGVVGASQVPTGDLQVASVDVALVEGYGAVRCDFFGRAASHGVVGAGDLCFRAIFFVSGEGDGAVFGVVGDAPDARGGFHQGLVAVGVVGRHKVVYRGVLVEGVGSVGCRVLLREREAIRHHDFCRDVRWEL